MVLIALPDVEGECEHVLQRETRVHGEILLEDFHPGLRVILGHLDLELLSSPEIIVA